MNSNVVTVLDLSRAALAQARDRLGPAAAQVVWMEADILGKNTPRLGAQNKRSCIASAAIKSPAKVRSVA